MTPLITLRFDSAQAADRDRYQILAFGFMSSPLQQQPGPIEKLERELAVMDQFTATGRAGEPSPRFGGQPVWQIKVGVQELTLTEEQAQMVVVYVLAIGWGTAHKRAVLEAIRFIQQAQESNA